MSSNFIMQNKQKGMDRIKQGFSAVVFNRNWETLIREFQLYINRNVTKRGTGSKNSNYILTRNIDFWGQVMEHIVVLGMRGYYSRL